MGFPDKEKGQGLAEPAGQRRRVEKLVWLVKKGDAPSLSRLRIELNKSRAELAGALGISEKLLARYLNDFSQDWQTKISLRPTKNNHLCLQHNDSEDEFPCLAVDVKLDGKDLIQESNTWHSHPWGTLTREGRRNEGRCKVWARPFGEFVELYVTVENRMETAAEAIIHSNLSGSGWEGGAKGPWATGFVWEKRSLQVPPGKQKTFRGRLYLFKTGGSIQTILQAPSRALKYLFGKPGHDVMTEEMKKHLDKRFEEALTDWRMAQPLRLHLP